jgi:amino acid permease
MCHAHVCPACQPTDRSIGTQVFALVGATGSTTICYILPGLFYYGIKRHEGWEWRKVVAVFMFFFGVVFMIISCTVIIINLAEGKDVSE